MPNKEYNKGVEEGYQITKRLYQKDHQAREAIRIIAKVFDTHFESDHHQNHRPWVYKLIGNIFSQPNLLKISKMSFSMPCPKCQFGKGHSRACSQFKEPEKPTSKYTAKTDLLKQIFNYRELKAVRESLIYSKHRMSVHNSPEFPCGLAKSGVKIKDIIDTLNKLI